MGLVAKAFQDIITFSRASSGTYVNSNGYITNSSVLNYLTYSNAPENAAWTKSNSFVQQNIQTYSQDFDNAAWLKGSGGTGSAPVVTANASIAPDGTLTADLIALNLGGGTTLTDQSNLTGTSATTTTGAPYNGSIYVIAATSADVGKIIAFRHAGGTTYSLITLTSSWQRFSVNETAVSTTGAITFGLRGSIGSSTGAVSFYAWGAQLVQGSVPGDYRATTSAALPCLYADYNGALRARKLCEDATASVAHRILPNSAITIDAAGMYSYSWFVKAGEITEARLTDNNVSGATFNLLTGASSSISAGFTASSVNLGNGWWRLIVSGAAATSSGRILIYLSKAGSTTYTGDGSSGIYIADAQLNDGSSALAYYDTTASAYNAPRFDYDPVTLAAKGLLVEESRANLLLQSNDWSATWINSNITRTAGAALGPDGQMSMTKLEATTSTNTTCRQQLVATSTAHTFSVYVKQGSGATQANLFAVYNNTTLTDIAVLNFNYSTGVVTQTTGTGATATNAGNGIWRIVIPVTSGITIGNTITVYPLFSGAVETAGEFAYVYGAQVEAGAFATSYIPTVASQVTRAADVASVNTLSPWFNQAAGTFYAEFDIFGVSGSGNILGDGAVATSIAYLNPTFNLVSYNGVSGPTTGNATSANTIAKASLAYATNSRRAVLNAGTASNQTGDLQVLTKLELGKAFGNTYLNGHLRRITYYPRQFTAAEQQTLTTL